MYENNYSDNTYHYGEPVKKQEEPHNKKKGSGNGKKIALGICCGLLSLQESALKRSQQHPAWQRMQ